MNSSDWKIWSEAKLRSYPAVCEWLDGRTGGHIGGMVPIYDLGAMIEVIEAVDARAYFEIGVNTGETAALLHRMYPDMQITGIDFAKDLSSGLMATVPPVQYHETVDNEHIGAALLQSRLPDTPDDLFHLLEGDSRKASSYPEDFGPFDVVFVDGSHQFDDVLADTQIALKFLSPDGVVIYHDTGYHPALTSREAVERLAWAWEVTYIVGTHISVLDPSGRGLFAGDRL